MLFVDGSCSVLLSQVGASNMGELLMLFIAAEEGSAPVSVSSS